MIFHDVLYLLPAITLTIAFDSIPRFYLNTK